MMPKSPKRTPTPDHALLIGLGFWCSKALLSAVELGLFPELAQAPLVGPDSMVIGVK
jgi:hypothetical protein